MVKFIETGDVPSDLAQPKSVYLEQIEILKPILKTLKDTNTVQAKQPDTKPEAKLETSKGSNSRLFEKQQKKQMAEAGTSQKKGASAEEIERKTGIVTLSSIKVLPYDKNSKKGTMLEKLERTAPYNLFFTTISKSPDTLNQFNSATFTGTNVI